MTKQELIEKVAKETGVSKATAGKTIDTILDSIKAALKKGQKVALIGFGAFSVSKRKARKGRNPQTGKEIKIAARKVPRFSAGKGLKDAVK